MIGLAEDEVANVSVEPGERPQAVDVERVLHEAHVEDDVRLERDAVLVAEADQLAAPALAVVGQVQRAVQSARAAGGRTARTCR